MLTPTWDKKHKAIRQYCIPRCITTPASGCCGCQTSNLPALWTRRRAPARAQRPFNNCVLTATPTSSRSASATNAVPPVMTNEMQALLCNT